MKPPHPFTSVQTWLDVDRLVHEPARLVILTVLNSSESAEFKFLQAMTGLTKGNLSSHTAKLESANYIHIAKRFRGKVPSTTYRITPQGRTALQGYLRAISVIARDADPTSLRSR